MVNATSSHTLSSSADVGTGSPLSKLSDAQVFAKDPEQFTDEDVSETVERLKKILGRYRKARQDSAEIAEAAAKIKATNTKARKTKAKKSSAQVFEETST
jgi:hypothetical protein